MRKALNLLKRKKVTPSAVHQIQNMTPIYVNMNLKLFEALKSKCLTTKSHKNFNLVNNTSSIMLGHQLNKELQFYYTYRGDQQKPEEYFLDNWYSLPNNVYVEWYKYCYYDGPSYSDKIVTNYYGTFESSTDAINSAISRWEALPDYKTSDIRKREAWRRETRRAWLIIIFIVLTIGWLFSVI